MCRHLDRDEYRIVQRCATPRAKTKCRLDAGTTKNNGGRMFLMTDDMRTPLKAQQAEHERLKKAGHLCPFVFFRMVADERRGREDAVSS